jgi:hypothetical protein
MENTYPALRFGPSREPHRDLQGMWQVAAGCETPLTSPAPLTR